ncbi:hypothetical protein OGAPHI_005571 [Ogataea philodendri]|uniref:Uncharacterized protein n=1 Tax=Ogataea philodendri TaxID=1378263 RepID=A0A9P8NZF7_9ASCO|nr:uncharacterized protein OGAPHI_005571 [Ogataea philodendri]KAH3662320.1 hypothetical protein OGAPHI_005571 [Ogataea philodendri]
MISRASASPDPRRWAGSLVNSLCRMSTASFDMLIGYNGSSVKMALKTSSSSSPLNGDLVSSIWYKSTPNAHQSTALS